MENQNKGNLLHSCILELFEYLSKEYNKKITLYFMEQYENQLFKNPLYEKDFKNFIAQYEKREELHKG